MIEVTERPDRASVKWDEAWRGTTWNLDGTIVLVLGPGRQDWQALCFLIHDVADNYVEGDDNPDEWACSWFTTRGVRLA